MVSTSDQDDNTLTSVWGNDLEYSSVAIDKNQHSVATSGDEKNGENQKGMMRRMAYKV